jgi:methionyl-tRNA synthetase
MKFYVTTAIDYPNAEPHIGHAYEKIIADFFARWHRLKGDSVFFLTGTDEHGQKIEKTAKLAQKDTQKFLDEMSESFKKLCRKYNISNDHFIRTTDKDHKSACQKIFQKVVDKGLIYKGSYEGFYCTGCESFYLEKDLEEGKICPVHKKEVDLVKEESYFFKMSIFQDKLIKHIKNNPDFILPSFRAKEIINRLEEGLKDLCVSRTSFKWGIQLPDDPEHVIYVWFDALLNYITGLGYPDNPDFKDFWPADVHHVGKDIMWFHTVIWPCILMAADFELPKTVFGHGFINIKGEKLSKSRGIKIDPIKLAENYGSDRLRYFLLREIPAGMDGDFSEEFFIERTNADLADSLGNLLQRTLSMIKRYFSYGFPEKIVFNEAEEELIKKIPDIKKLNSFIDSFEWNKFIECVWDFVRECNAYIAKTEPWKASDERKAAILYTLAEFLRLTSLLVYPVIPEAAEKIAKQMGSRITSISDYEFRKGKILNISEPEILFAKLEFKKDESLFSELNLKVAFVENIEDHPDSDKLYVIKIDLGSEKRTLVAGLKPYLDKKEILGKKIIVVSNLKPAKLRGVESQGMLLAAEKGSFVKLLEAEKSCAGDQVFIEDVAPKTDLIKIDDFVKIKLEVKDKNVFFEGKILKTDKENIKVDIDDGAEIR